MWAVAIITALIAISSCGPKSKAPAGYEDRESFREPIRFDCDDVDSFPAMIEEGSIDYPKSARWGGVTGIVWIKVLVNEEGKVVQATVHGSSGSELLDTSALKSAYTNKFKPATRSGEPVECWVTYKVEFALDK